MSGATLVFSYSRLHALLTLPCEHSIYCTIFFLATYLLHVVLQAIIDLLLSSGANSSLKDNEGRVAEDFDYQPPSADEASEESHKMEL